MKTNVRKGNKMEKPIIKLIFRERVTEEVYLFDISLRKTEEYHPHMVGRIAVNLSTEEKIMYMNSGAEISGDYELIASAALDSAKNMQKLIGE